MSIREQELHQGTLSAKKTNTGKAHGGVYFCLKPNHRSVTAALASVAGHVEGVALWK